MKQDKILELDSITAGYDNNIVLDNINLTIHKKDFLGIIGPNGGGKTTLLKIILGLLAPFKGQIKFYIKQNIIGYLPQFKNFDNKFPITVDDVVLSGLTSKKGLFHCFSNEDRKKSDELLEATQICHLKKKPIGELSGGQMQRVFLCRALINSPELLILDEPNTFVDKTFENNLFEILKELNKKISIILVSHDIGVISSYIKNIACVNGTLHYHKGSKYSEEFIQQGYCCPVDMITHGDVPHRVLKKH